MLPVSKIRPNSFNVNFMDPETYQMLVRDVKKNGVLLLEPIQVRKVKDFYECINGEQRFRAVKDAGWPKIPSLIFDVTEDEARVLCYQKNRERGKIDPILEAKLFAYEKKRGLTSEQMAKKYNLSSPQYVRDSLQLLGIREDVAKIIPPSIREQKSKLRLLAGLKDPDKQVQAIKEISESETVTDKQLEERIKELKLGEQPRKPSVEKPEKEEELFDGCTFTKGIEELRELNMHRHPSLNCSQIGCQILNEKLKLITKEYDKRTKG